MKERNKAHVKGVTCRDCPFSKPNTTFAEVVRCKDCKYSREDKELVDMYGCTLYRDMRKGSDFCNYGEVRK